MPDVNADPDPYEVQGDEPCALLGRPPEQRLPEKRAPWQSGKLRVGGPSTWTGTVNEGIFRTLQILHAASGRQVNVRLRPAPTGYSGGQAAWEAAAQTQVIAAMDAVHASGVPNAAQIILGAR